LHGGPALENIAGGMSTLASDILELVRIPSATDHEGELASLLEKRLAEGPASKGNRIARTGDSVLVIPDGDDSRPLIVLAGHIDTVPPGETPEPYEADGRIYGRGTSDMKSGVAVMLALAERLPARAGFARRAFIFYAGEEGSAKGNALAGILERETWLRSAGLAVLLEPTTGDLELGCNGSIHLEVVFRGIACHSARPWMGSHPLRNAIPWLEAILGRPMREVEISGALFREVITLTTIHAGDVRNVVPSALSVNLNLRYAPDRTREEAESLARSLPPQGLADLPDGTPAVEVRVLDHSPAGRIDDQAPLFRYLCERTQLPRRGKQGWTDVARFTASGVPALNWGPGDPELAHTKQEYIDVAAADLCLQRMTAFFLAPGPGKAMQSPAIEN
jgi:succinyl-diaminopimelate desuccinylase